MTADFPLVIETSTGGFSHIFAACGFKIWNHVQVRQQRKKKQDDVLLLFLELIGGLSSLAIEGALHLSPNRGTKRAALGGRFQARQINKKHRAKNYPVFY
jgi:hypothetical protein